jgi:hypothetical protein
VVDMVVVHGRPAVFDRSLIWWCIRDLRETSAGYFFFWLNDVPIQEGKRYKYPSE